MSLRQIFLDVETSGLGAQEHRIIELAAIEAIDGQLTGKYFHTYLNPQRSISTKAYEVHGISLNDLVDKPKFYEIADDFIEFMRHSECLIHNASFDSKYINAELSRAGYSVQLQDISQVSCTLKLARKNFPGLSNSLDTLILRAQLGTPQRQQHSALDDAILLAQVYFKLLAPTTSSPVKSYPSSLSSWPSPKSTLKPRMTIEPSEQVAVAIHPKVLGMEHVIDLVEAKQETFFYRQKHKRIITYHVINLERWEKIKGPLLYAVADKDGIVRYVGKWVSSTPLYSRWLRHNTIHHQESARNFYLNELDTGRGPLSVWSISIEEMRNRLPKTIQTMTAKDLAESLEALWIKRWQNQLLWNIRPEKVPEKFDDGEFWKQNN